MVCKQWNIVGTELLYEKVVFHRVGQISALARTLQGNTSLGKLIKSVDVRCFVPSGYITLVKADLGFILHRCPHLVQLALYEFRSSVTTFQDIPLHNIRIRSALPIIYFTQDLAGVLSRLTHLECSDVVEFSDMVLMLQICNELQSLVCHLPNGEPNLLQPNSYLHLGQLESLRFTIKSESATPLLWVTTHWSMPALIHLSMYEYGNGITNDHATRYCEPFFEKYGHTLKYLHLRRVVSTGLRRIDMLYLLISCPLLEHLVLSANIMSVTPMTHASIIWIDFWGPGSYTDLHGWFSLARFPALRGIRELDRGLPDTVEWPLVLPPKPNIEDLTFEHPGLHIRDNTRGIFKKVTGSPDDILTFHCSDMGSDFSDGSFRTPTEIDSDGNWSSDEDVEEDVEVVSEAEDWANREMALEIFAQTRK